MGFLDLAFWTSLFAIGVRIAAAIGIAGIGELLSERSGVLNLGVEGILMISGLGGAIAATVMNNPWFGLLVGVGVGAFFGLVHSGFCVTLKVDQTLAGLGIFFLGSGLAVVLYRAIAPGGLDIPGISAVEVPVLNEIPFLGEVVFHHNPIVYLSFVLPVLVWIFLEKTKTGLRVRTVGERPDLADTMGINVSKYRYIYTGVGAALMGFAGAYLSIVRYNTFMIDLTHGLGWIAIGIVYFGKWNPGRTYLGAIMFGIFLSLQTKLQTIYPGVPYQFFVMLPYVLVIVMLVLISREAAQPDAIGKPYEREG